MVHGILRISFLYLAGVLAGGCSPGGDCPHPPIGPCHQGRALGGARRGEWGCWALLGTTLQCQHRLAGGWGAMQAVIN